MVKRFLETVVQLLFGVSKQDIKNFLFSKKWYCDWYPEFYFLKINNNWSRFDGESIKNYKFKSKEELQNVYRADWYFWLYCKNQPECKNVINFAGKFLGEKTFGDNLVWGYKCSCCGTVQYYLMLGPFTVNCDENGNPLEVGMTIEA